MAVVAFPTFAYNATQSPQVVASQAALNALGPTWVLTPFASTAATAPADPGFLDTDIRLQQILIELRVANHYLYANAQQIADDPNVLRSDLVLNDVALTS